MDKKKKQVFEAKTVPGIIACLIIAVPAWLLGLKFPIIGGPIFGILMGMILAFFQTTCLIRHGNKIHI